MSMTSEIVGEAIARAGALLGDRGVKLGVPFLAGGGSFRVQAMHPQSGATLGLYIFSLRLKAMTITWLPKYGEQVKVRGPATVAFVLAELMTTMPTPT